MSLISRIHSAIQTAAVTIGSLWHDHLEPWLGDFLGNVAHAEVTAVLPIATRFVTEAIPALVTAAGTGNWQGFADAQWDAVVNTAQAAEQQAIKVAITSVATAVNALIVGHPAVAAAAAIPVTPAPAG